MSLVQIEEYKWIELIEFDHRVVQICSWTVHIFVEDETLTSLLPSPKMNF